MKALAEYAVSDEVVVQSGSTTTYRATHVRDGKPVLLKMLTAESPTLLDIARLRNEHKVTQLVTSPLVLKSDLKHLGEPVLVLEGFGGVRLDDAIPGGGFEPGLFLWVAIQLAQALEDLQAQGIIHKDIHPGSILFDRDTGSIKLTNFAIASQLSRENQGLESPTRLEGTLAYMSPEQTGRMNRPIDYRTDFYSLGVTLYQMLTGRLPFTATDPLELVHAHVARQPPPPGEVRPGVPEQLASIVTRLLAKEAEERYQSARGLRIDLERCLSIWSAEGRIEPFPTGGQDRSERLHAPQKLYGRDAELSALVAALGRVADGATELLLVQGYSGVGKSTLVNELQRSVARRRGRFVAGKFDQLRRGLPHSAFLQAFRQLILQLLTEDDAQLAAWKGRLQTALGANSQVVVDVIPELELILGPQPAVPPLGPAEAQNRFRQTFQRFIRAFARKDHPLVLFLDDLQWADVASLELVEYLAADTDGGHLLLIAAYRDNEIGVEHALSRLLKRIGEGATQVTFLSVQPLGRADLEAWLADTLGCDPGRAAPLAGVLFDKTHGNPFFVLELLKTLHQERLLVFDSTMTGEHGTGGWRWEQDRIEAVRITENVVDLLIGKLQKLSPDAQAVAKLAACMGSRFDSRILTIASDLSPRRAVDALWEVVQAGLILPVDQSYKILRSAALGDSGDDAFLDLSAPHEFLHDRVQQAAYSLIPEETRRATHLAIGRLMRQHLSAEQTEEWLFQIVDHLNMGLSLVEDLAERQAISRLNLAAGRKAKAATAYEPALGYFSAGSDLLGPEGFRLSYELAFALHLERAECEYLTTRFAEANNRFELLLHNACSDRDRVAVYTARVVQHLHLREYEQAVRTGVLALRLLGLRVQAAPGIQDVLLELVRVRWKLRGREVARLIDLPDRTTPEIRAAMSLLISLWFPAYLLKREQLVGVIVLKMVNLSLTYGNTEASSFAFVCFGMLNSSVFNDPETGVAFGKLALALARKFNVPSITCRTLFVHASFLEVFSSHLRTTLGLLEEALRSSIDSGNLVQAGFCMSLMTYWSRLVGTPIGDVAAEARRFLEFARRVDSQKLVQCTRVALRWAEELQSASPAALYAKDHSLEPDAHITEEMERAQHYLFQMQVGYLFGRHEEVVEFSRRLESYKEMLDPSSAFVPHHAFYRALAALALLPTASGADERRLRKDLDKARRTLRKWSEHSAVNARHKLLLVLAEDARVGGAAYRAAELYHQAISAARESGYIHDMAVACERAALFFLSSGDTRRGRAYLQEARVGYLAWGATAKVRALDEQHAELLAQPSPREERGGPATVFTRTELDLKTVLKASQVLSGALVLDELLRQVMQIVIENAGAQRGFLILADGDRLVIEAARATDQAEIVVLQSTPLESCPDLALSVVHYVHRTLLAVVLDDASQEGLFTRDPYVLRQRPRSILCTPLGRQGQLGLLYLENNLTTRAFTPERLEVLRLLSSQIAISIENARLYASLEQKVAQRTEELRQKNLDLENTLRHLRAAQTQLVHQEKLAALGKLTAGIAHEIKNPLNFINNFSEVANELCDELLDEGADLRVAAVRETLSDLRTSTQKILDHGKRADGIVRSMLELSRVRTGERKPTDLNGLIEEYAKLSMPGLRGMGDEPEVHLQRDYDEAVGLVELVAPEIGQVVLNLLSNALHAVRARRAAEGGSYVPRVTVRTRSRGAHVEISVEDNGPGVPHEHRDKLFEPFFTTKPAGQGTGLGLSLSYDIVVQGHRGQMTVESEEGHSTTFCVLLPRARAPEEAARGHRSA